MVYVSPKDFYKDQTVNAYLQLWTNEWGLEWSYEEFCGSILPPGGLN